MKTLIYQINTDTGLAVGSEREKRGYQRGDGNLNAGYLVVISVTFLIPISIVSSTELLLCLRTDSALEVWSSATAMAAWRR
jgi:hypothetical protein